MLRLWRPYLLEKTGVLLRPPGFPGRIITQATIRKICYSGAHRFKLDVQQTEASTAQRWVIANRHHPGLGYWHAYVLWRDLWAVKEQRIIPFLCTAREAQVLEAGRPSLLPSILEQRRVFRFKLVSLQRAWLNNAGELYVWLGIILQVGLHNISDFEADRWVQSRNSKVVLGQLPQVIGQLKSWIFH
jgi:hypothetical protein